MLIALLMISMFGGGGEYVFFEDNFTDNVKEVILEEDRKKEILELYEAFQNDFKEFQKNKDGLAVQFSQLSKKKDSTDEELKDIVDQIMMERSRVTEDLISKRYQMVSKVSEEEWEKIMSTETE